MTGSREMFQEQREIELIEQMRPFPVSKSAIAQKAIDAVETILEAEISLEMAQAFSAVEKFIEAVKKDNRFLDAIREKIEKEGKSVTLWSGTKIELAETGTEYDYSQDEEWLNLEQQIKPLKEKQKERQDFLKKIPAGKQLIEDGVIIATGPAKSSTSSFKVTLK